MKHVFRSLTAILFFGIGGFATVNAQVTTRPSNIPKGYTQTITLTYDPYSALGDSGMVGAAACYSHIGLLTANSSDDSDWKYVKPGDFGTTDQVKWSKFGKKWQLTISPDIYDYFECPMTEEIIAIVMVFHDGTGDDAKVGRMADGSNIKISLSDPGLQASIVSPSDNALFFGGEEAVIRGVSTHAGTLTLSINGEEVASATASAAITYSSTFATGDYQIIFTANDGNAVIADTMSIHYSPATQLRPRPAGVELGITYDPDDDTKVTLCTFAAANKVANDNSELVPARAVYVVGDFNNWTVSADYQMFRDSCHFWFTLDNLTPRKEYAYQYVVVRSDGVTRWVSDGFADKQLHPDDQYEPQNVDPVHYIKYPSKADGGYCSVFQTGQTPYHWSDATLNFVRPDKNDLIIYELWVYDFTPSRSFAGVMQRLDYLQKLGVNAIEFMPVCEFDGNYNWGYGPNHYFAVDKAYGSKDMFKALVDSIHGRGMAVIMDMVFNHATGNNPQNKLYPYGNDLKFNPWFNVNPPHSDTYFEDWNHDFPEVENMFTRCLNYWLDEYKVDGFRMDLSHGFCGTSYDAYEHISHYYDYAIAPHNAYFILEHWGKDGQKPYIDKGMLCWTGAGLANAYCQLAMGYFTSDNISDANRDGYVSYAESHDEERNFYKAKAYGAGGITSNEAVRLKRVPLVVGFLTLLNGPHMLWMNEELGYDYSINSAKGASDISDKHRTDIKMQPAELGWFSNANRMAAYEACAKIINLRTKIAPQYFSGKPVSASLTGGKALRSIVWGEEGNRLAVAGNFNTTGNAVYNLPADGVWYDYLNETTFTGKTVTLGIGEIKILMQQPATALDAAMTTPNLPTKVLLNGQVYINNNGTLYDLFGRRYE